MCIVELIACEAHGAVTLFHVVCLDRMDPLACLRLMHKQRLGVSYPQEPRAIGRILILNREIAARNSEIDRLKLVIGTIVSQAKAALELFQQASTACGNLTYLLSQREELLLEQSMLRSGLVGLPLKGESRSEQEIRWQVRRLCKMLEVLAMELQNILLTRQECIGNLKDIPLRRVVNGDGVYWFGLCDCNEFEFAKL